MAEKIITGTLNSRKFLLRDQISKPKPANIAKEKVVNIKNREGASADITGIGSVQKNLDKEEFKVKIIEAIAVIKKNFDMGDLFFRLKMAKKVGIKPKYAIVSMESPPAPK